MLIDLKSIQNSNNGFIYINVGTDYVLRLNTLDEEIDFNGLSLKINEINIDLIDVRRNVTENIPNIIGLETGDIQIVTEHSELIGQKLNSDNKDNCYIFTLIE